MKTVMERFIKYISKNTTSDGNSESFPSTKSQIEFGKLLADECTKIGLSEVKIDDNGYVTASLETNTTSTIPTIGFIAHMDTSPDASGENIKPNVIENYNGTEIKLNGISISPTEFPELKNYIGDTIITSDGTTLLGADDKAGIAEILTAMEYLISHPEITHGKIKIAFTPDEEIGKGVDYFNAKNFGADFAYTIDGGKIGELEYENFNAARAEIKINGRSVHPGTAKGIMKNAALIGTEMASLFHITDTPATTEGYEGFFHLVSFEGNVSSARLVYIIRDFKSSSFEERKTFVKTLVEKLNKKYGDIITLKIHDEYYNMISVIEKNMSIVDLALKAFAECKVKPIVEPIRGGTDGARLSFIGIPCPNIFTGGHNFHGPYEFIPVSSMEKACEIIVKIAELNVLNKK